MHRGLYLTTFLILKTLVLFSFIYALTVYKYKQYYTAVWEKSEQESKTHDSPNNIHYPALKEASLVGLAPNPNEEGLGFG